MIDIRDGNNQKPHGWSCVRGVAKPGAVVALLLASGGLAEEPHFDGDTDRSIAAHASSKRADSGVRITERPPDAYLDNRDLSASGDFDNDGRLDEAFLVQTGDDSALKISLVVSFGSAPQIPYRIVDTFAGAYWSNIRNFGLRVAHPGKKWIAACARGYGDPCGDDEEEELTLTHDAIYFYDFESSSLLYYLPEQPEGALPEGAVNGDFKEFWLSD